MAYLGDDVGLWVGGFEESYGPHGATRILNVASELEAGERVGVAAFAKLGVRDDDPDEDISRILDAAVAFCAGGPTFVHCLEGVSRSVCVVACVMAVRAQTTFDEALDLVKARRPQADPFPLYAAQCRTWLKQLSCGATIMTRDGNDCNVPTL